MGQVIDELRADKERLQNRLEEYRTAETEYRKKLFAVESERNTQRQNAIMYRNHWRDVCEEKNRIDKLLSEAKDEIDKLTTDRDKYRTWWENSSETIQDKTKTIDRLLAENENLEYARKNLLKERDAATAEQVKLAVRLMEIGPKTVGLEEENAKLRESLRRLERETLIRYTILGGGIEHHEFNWVSVFKKGSREIVCHLGNNEKWWVGEPGENKNYTTVRTRDEATAKCLKFFSPPEPKWRPAREDGSDNGKACRWKGHTDEDWHETGKLVLVFLEASNPYVVHADGLLCGFKFCEVKDE